MLKSIAIAAILSLAFLAFACLVTGTRPALADSSAHCWDFSGCPQKARKVRRKRKAVPKVVVERGHEPTYWREREDSNSRPLCVKDEVEVISTEHTTEDNALDAAKKMWAYSAQWTWGSQYMDLQLAEDFRYHCGPSNAMDTFSSKLNEAASTLVGKAGVNQRCVIRARPCRAHLEPKEGFR